MRAEFIQTLTELAAKDPRVLLLTGDLGYTIVEPFSEKFPERFFNIGVAEQNMVGIATGLAQTNFIPFVYSIANFAAMRPYEFIRNGPILHHLPVRILGIGGGFEYGTAGITHYALEDIGLMRLQKGITTIVPCDHLQAQTALSKTWNLPGPIYYRIGKGDKLAVPGLEGEFDLGRAHVVKDGTDFIFITMGSITKEVLKACEILATHGVSPSVMVVSCFNPSPDLDVKQILKKFSLAITVEEHFITGGLGSYVCETAAENPTSCRVIRCGVDQTYDGKSGSKDFMLKKHGLTAEQLAKTALKNLALLHK